MTRAVRMAMTWANGAVLTALLLAGAARLASGPTSGASDPTSGAPPPAEKLVRASALPVRVTAGGSDTVTVHLVLLPGWHVNANPPALEYNIPTKVKLYAGAGLRAGAASYPKGSAHKFGFEETPLLVYDAAADVRVPLFAAADAATGVQTLAGSVEFQACNDQVCLAPAMVPFTVQVTVAPGVPGAVSHAPAAADTGASATFSTAAPAGGSSSAVARNRLQAMLEKGGLGWFLALFVGGLLLNLTPCVFPMLGITVSIFGARQQERLPR